MATNQNFEDTERGRARSSIYGFFATAIRYPDAQTIRTLAESQRWSASMPLVKRSFPDLAEQLAAIRVSLSAFAFDQDKHIPALQVSHVRLFGHTVRGTCPPYELEYSKSEILQRANELADIAGFYQAFGMAPAVQSHERADHVGAQCEFMSVLGARQVYAIENKNEEAQQILTDAQRSFLTDHMGWWVPAFSSRLHEADPDGFYGRIGACLYEFIKVECHRFDAACGPQYLELRLADPKQDASQQCGVEESCLPASPDATGQTLVPLRIDGQ